MVDVMSTTGLATGDGDRLFESADRHPRICARDESNREPKPSMMIS